MQPCTNTFYTSNVTLSNTALLSLCQGSDTVPAMMLLRDFYDGGVAGYSCAASEHSTVISWGRYAELEAFRNTLQRYPDGQCGVIVASITRPCK